MTKKARKIFDNLSGVILFYSPILSLKNGSIKPLLARFCIFQAILRLFYFPHSTCQITFLEEIKDYQVPNDLDKIILAIFKCAESNGQLGERILFSSDRSHIGRTLADNINTQTWRLSERIHTCDQYERNIIIKGLPCTYIETAEFDCLRDEAISYAEALKNSQVSVELNQTQSTMHGFDIALNSKIVKNCINNRVAYLKKIFLFEDFTK